MGLVEEIRTLIFFKRSIYYWSDGGDENIQIIKNKKSGPRVKGT